MSKKEANERVLDFLSHPKESRVEFFFYANTRDDASNLAIELSRLGYKIECVDKSSNDKNWCISGWTLEMKMDSDSLTQWTDKMDRLAEENKCEFDGWGTFADKDDLNFNG